MSGRGVGTILAPAPRPRSGLGLNELLGCCPENKPPHTENSQEVDGEHQATQANVGREDLNEAVDQPAVDEDPSQRHRV